MPRGVLKMSDIDELRVELQMAYDLLVLAYDDDCGLMAWDGREELLLRAHQACGEQGSYWYKHLKNKITNLRRQEP